MLHRFGSRHVVPNASITIWGNSQVENPYLIMTSSRPPTRDHITACASESETLLTWPKIHTRRCCDVESTSMSSNQPQSLFHNRILIIISILSKYTRHRKDHYTLFHNLSSFIQHNIGSSLPGRSGFSKLTLICDMLLCVIYYVTVIILFIKWHMLLI